MWVVAARSAVLSVITGGGKWVEITTHADPLYQHLIVTAERKFLCCVESGDPPALFGVEPPKPRIEAVRIVDMSTSNKQSSPTFSFALGMPISSTRRPGPSSRAWCRRTRSKRSVMGGPNARNPAASPSISSRRRMAMQQSSSSIGALAAALAKAQAELVNPEKSMIATIPADEKLRRADLPLRTAIEWVRDSAQDLRPA
jgi:hypothetical protein